MIVKASPAGDLFTYMKSKRDAKGRKREFPPEEMHGNASGALAILHAQAPRGVRGPNPPAASAPPAAGRRPDTDWILHCQAHLVHLICGFHESRPHVEEHLDRINTAAEDLIGIGMSRRSLCFTWTKHPKTLGTHSHGALVLTQLLTGRPYAPNLDPKLLLLFARLVSHQFHFADPLDSRGVRVVYAAWASAKPANAADIVAVATAATAAWEAQPRRLSTLTDFLILLGALKFTVLVRPDNKGRPTRVNPHCCTDRAVPRLRNTVVVASRDGARIICFKGPICRPHFTAAELDARIEECNAAVAAMRENPGAVYHQFLALLRARCTAQQSLCCSPDEDRRSLAELAFLNPRGYQYDPYLGHTTSASALDALDPLVRWAEGNYPFAELPELPPDQADAPLDYVAMELERAEMAELEPAPELEAEPEPGGELELAPPPALVRAPAPALESEISRPANLDRPEPPSQPETEPELKRAPGPTPAPPAPPAGARPAEVAPPAKPVVATPWSESIRQAALQAESKRLAELKRRQELKRRVKLE